MKRQREMEKKFKAERKRQRRQERKEAPDDPPAVSEPDMEEVAEDDLI